ncbi:MAG: hypothetical protein AAGC54_18740, partial [Cyanobacteria bacterium P01_F01_bin.4]
MVQVSRPDPPLRIVSLIPSATEIVHALGWGSALVGRSHECDYPTSVEALPVCTATRSWISRLLPLGLNRGA